MKVVRILVYEGDADKLRKHLIQRGLKGAVSPSAKWLGRPCGGVSIKEYFLKDVFGLAAEKEMLEMFLSDSDIEFPQTKIDKEEETPPPQTKS